MPITTLIDKKDTVEEVRDQIAAILKLESEGQVTLAQAQGKPNPEEWRLRVYQERANRWEEMTQDDADDVPVVNVWWDSSSFNEKASNSVERQQSTATIHIDCYGRGTSYETAEGHVAADRLAAETAQRAARLARNILMAGEYTYLGMRKRVWRRWVDSISLLQPQQDNQNAFHIVVARIAFRVEFNEHSPQYEPEPLELLSAKVLRAQDGQILLSADYA